ncbi:putative lipoprotein [Helicobacter pylori SouthAfrica50]|uniref:Putative lipoprotein n=1 Tax=Helicobacter pylori SouthAfrica50 TaxID=1352357 RepID=T2SB78_HELPX|nr:putative lipoprotein [Helicobacter pylori SouthAfrica50]
MFFKPYQKLLGAGCLALYLVGCGGDSGEPLVGIVKNSFNSTIKIISKTDNIEIQDLKLNRGNCKHDKNVLLKLMQETANAYLFVSEKEKAIKNHQAKIARLQKDLEELTQYVQQFNNLDKFLENIYSAIAQMDYFKQAKEYGNAEDFDKAPRKFKLLYQTIGSSATNVANNSVLAQSLMGVNISLLDGYSYKYKEDNNAIYVVKKILDDPNTYKDGPTDELWNILYYIIRSAIEDTKNPKDYPYINLKELKKLIDSIGDGPESAGDFWVRIKKEGFFDSYDVHVSKKGLQSLAKLKSMWPSVGKFYFAYLKEAIPRHAKEITDKLIASEEKSIKANQVKLTEATQNIDKMEKIIKDLESKKNTMAVDLKFGETFTADYECQNLIEVEVKTDKGAWTFNFNR